MDRTSLCVPPQHGVNRPIFHRGACMRAVVGHNDGRKTGTLMKENRFSSNICALWGARWRRSGPKIILPLDITHVVLHVDIVQSTVVLRLHCRSMVVFCGVSWIL